MPTPIPPDQIPPVQPDPQVAEAYEALLLSPLFQRIEAIAAANIAVNTQYTNLGTNFAAGLSGHWMPPAVSASISKLAIALVDAGAPLTTEEQDWISQWNSDHHLGITLPWG